MALEVDTLTRKTFISKGLSDKHWLWWQFSTDYLYGDFVSWLDEEAPGMSVGWICRQGGL